VTTSTLTSLVSPLTSGGEAAATPAVAQAGLTREAIDATPSELLLVSLVSRGSVDVLAQIADTGKTTTWISSDGVSVTLNDGMVVATRGSGVDLMGADTAAARQSLRGGGTHKRVYDTLDGLGQIQTAIHECSSAILGRETITIVERDFVATKWREDCRGSGLVFANLYWVSDAGEIIQSRQFVSVGLGYLVFQKL